MAKKLAKAQVGRIVKKAVKSLTKNYNIPRSVGSVEKSNIRYPLNPEKKWHGPEGRKSSNQYKKDDIAYKVGVGSALGAGAAAGAAMAAKKKMGGSTKSNKTKKK